MSTLATVTESPSLSLPRRRLDPLLNFRLLSAEECMAAMHMGLALPMGKALVESGYDGIRSGGVAWLDRKPETAWLFDRIARFAYSYAKSQVIHVDELCPTLQFVKYAPRGYFNWHTDIGANESGRRKVTICVQLTSAEDYEGGDLEFVGGRFSIWRRAKGSATAFPSILGHRLTEVSRGTRYALVAWMLGQPYR